MSFCGDNNTFGQNEVEDSNVVLTDGKEVNNISFECNNNQNSPLKEEDDKNKDGIFDHININTDENERQSFFQFEFLILQVYSSVYRLCKIVNDKMVLRKLTSLLLLRDYSQKKKMMVIRAEYVYTSIVFALKNCLRISRRQRKQSKLKYLFRWREEYLTNKQLALLREKIEATIEKKNEREYNELNAQLNEKEKEVNDLNKNLANLQTFESELKRRLKTFEEKEIALVDKIKGLEQKNSKYKEMISSKMTKGSSGSEMRSFESKIKQLEAQLVSMQDENKEKDSTITSFMKEMNEMLQFHEQNIENYQQEENMKRITSPKGANSNIICFTTGSVNSKRPSSSLRNNYAKPKTNYSNANK